MHSSICAAAGHQLPRRVKGETGDAIGVALQALTQFSTGHIPDINRPIAASRGQGAAVRADGSGVERAALSTQGAVYRLRLPALPLLQMNQLIVANRGQ